MCLCVVLLGREAVVAATQRRDAEVSAGHRLILAHDGTALSCCRLRRRDLFVLYPLGVLACLATLVLTGFRLLALDANRNDATAVDNLNRATMIGGVSRTYDILGNTLTKGSVTLGWDAVNRLTSYNGSAAYTYRADGMRV